MVESLLERVDHTQEREAPHACLFLSFHPNNTSTQNANANANARLQVSANTASFLTFDPYSFSAVGGHSTLQPGLQGFSLIWAFGCMLGMMVLDRVAGSAEPVSSQATYDNERLVLNVHNQAPTGGAQGRDFPLQ